MVTTRTKPCPTCGMDFDVSSPRQKYCSIPCRTKVYEQKRSTATHEALCRTCGKPLEAATGSRPRNYCNQACRTEGWRRRHAVVEITCEHCGKVVRRPPTGVAHAKHHFCSQACKGKWMSANLLGERHPNWKGGNIEYLNRLIHANGRARDWAATVLANAGGTCERCGNPAQDAHHKREVEELLALILDPANGEALCKNCHVGHHR